MRALIGLLPFLAVIAGCDTQTPSPPQGKAENKTENSATPLNENFPQAAVVDRSKKGTPAPTDGFATADGKPARIADFKGKPVLVNLWATWCAPCIKELPGLDAIAAREAGRLTVLAISQDTDPAIVPAWWAKRGFKALTTYIDKDGKLPFALDSGTLPTTVLYDAQGKEVWRVVGERDWEAGDVAGLLAEASTQ